MKSRFVTVTLAVAMGLCLSITAFSQIEPEPPTFVSPEEGVDDSSLSELPLQGVPIVPPSDVSGIDELTQLPADAPTAPAESAWLYAVRREFMLAPWPKIALGFGGTFLLAGLTWLGLAAGRKSKRPHRRKPRAAGGPPPKGLEEVVATVQFAHKGRDAGTG